MATSDAYLSSLSTKTLESVHFHPECLNLNTRKGLDAGQELRSREKVGREVEKALRKGFSSGAEARSFWSCTRTLRIIGLDLSGAARIA